MSIIDTKAWKAFRLGDLFDVVPTKGKNTYGLEDGCDLAYIAASRENNGVNRMIAKDNMADFISAGNCLVFIHIGDAAAGFCHYVRDDFVGMAGKTSCGYLKNHVMTETLGLFLAGVIRNVNEGLYSFGESWTGNRLMDTMLPLPATPDGQPDWAYMDAYMSEVLKKEDVFAEHLASLTAEAVADGYKLDTSGWKEFRLGDLFDVVPTKGKNTYGLEDGCDLAYIAASRENNGVNRMIAKDNMADFISAGNCLVFIHIGDAAAGFCHYVRDDFVGMAGKTSCGYLKNHVMTETLGLFLAGVIRNVNEGLYSFGESWTGNRLMDTMLPLPATPDGQPDWAYMDAYMSEVLKKEEVFAEHLASLTAEAVADGHKLDTSGWKAFRLGGFV